MGTHDPETNPAAFLGDELRRARLAAGFASQDALAARLGFDRSVITKVENGDRPPSVDVLSAWCAATNLDPEHFRRLAVLARRAAGVVPTWFEGWLEAEREAHTLRWWSPLLIPGLLQTADYARAIFMTEEDDEEQASRRADARLERRAILDQLDPPHLIVVLDEMVLHRPIGSPVIMADQLEYLVSVGGRKNVSIHVLPATGANAGLSGTFALASADGSPETMLLEAVQDQVTQDRALVRRAFLLFDLVHRDALPRLPSRNLIVEAIEQWKTR